MLAWLKPKLDRFLAVGQRESVVGQATKAVDILMAPGMLFRWQHLHHLTSVETTKQFVSEQTAALREPAEGTK